MDVHSERGARGREGRGAARESVAPSRAAARPACQRARWEGLTVARLAEREHGLWGEADMVDRPTSGFAMNPFYI